MKISISTDNGILIEVIEHVEEYDLDDGAVRHGLMENIKAAVADGIRYCESEATILRKKE